MMTQRFTVEFDRRSAGIAVRVPGGFVFYSSGPEFEHLDGRVFPRARAIERQLRRSAGERRVQAPISPRRRALA